VVDILSRVRCLAAEERFSEVVSDDCIVESDSNGPTLFEVARKAVVAVMIGLSALGTVPQASAGELPSPLSVAAQNYFQDTREALAEQGTGTFGLGITDILVLNSDGAKYSYWEDNKDVQGVGKIPFFGRDCVVTYSNGKYGNGRLTSALNVPKGFDYGAFEKMNAVSACSVIGLLESESREQYDDTTSDHLPLVEITTLAATAKYQPERLSEIYGVLNGLAYSQLRTETDFGQVEAVWKLSALDKIYAFASTPEGEALMGYASPKQLVDLADMSARAAQSEVRLSGIAETAGSHPRLTVEMKRIAQTDNGIDTYLEGVGLDGPASAVRFAQGTKISKGGGYEGYINRKTPAGCSNISRLNKGKEAMAKLFCMVIELADTSHWDVQGKTYVGDFNEIAPRILSQTPVKTSATESLAMSSPRR
jgi:hypothetical protein